MESKPAGKELRRVTARYPQVPPWTLRAALVLREVVVETARGFRADRGFDLAGSLAFASLLTAVPLLATFSLFLAAFFQENVGSILDVVNAILPYHSARVTENLREFVAESSAISGIGLAILLVTSLRLLFLIEEIFNAVWGSPKRRQFWRRSALYTLGLFALSLLCGSIGLGARLLRGAGMSNLVDSAAIGTLVPLVAEFCALALLYRYLPSAGVRWAPAAIAAGAVAVSLEVLRSLLGLYVKALSRVNLITGSLTLILLTLASIYFVWALVLVGVELTHVLQTGVARRRIEGARPAGRAENAIRMLLALATAGPRTFTELTQVQQSPPAEAEQILGCLKERRVIDCSPTEGYALLKRPHRITVAEIVEAVSPNLYALSGERGDPVASILKPLFQRLDGERRAVLDTTLSDLADR